MSTSLSIASSRPAPGSRGTRTNRRLIIASTLIGITLFASTPTVSAKGKPGNTNGPKPRTDQILPISLGPAAECPLTAGFDLNNGDTAGLYVVGQGLECSNPARVGAVRWSQGLGMQYLGLLPGSTGSSAEGISEDGTIVGFTGGQFTRAFILEPGAVELQPLKPLAGTVHATAENISDNGLYIVGASSTEADSNAVIWERIGTTWEPRDLGRGGTSTAVANDGSALFNTGLDEAGTVYSAWVIGTNGSRTILPGFDVIARDISADGDFIVGFRRETCPDPCGKYPIPVFWELQPGGAWSDPIDLPALDGMDSEARAVAKRGGQRLIVGHGFTKKNGIHFAPGRCMVDRRCATCSIEAWNRAESSSRSCRVSCAAARNAR